MVEIKKMKIEYFFILVLLVMLYGCPLCINKVITENGPLVEEYKLSIPYQDGKIYKLKYSDSLVINFTAQRILEDLMVNNCAECCGETQFQIDKTILTADYPLFDIQFELNNRDTTNIECYTKIGNTYFYIPVTEAQITRTDKIDSLIIDSISYKNVYVLYSNYSTNSNKPLDSLFYNYDFGIVKLILSNDEIYTIFK